MDDSWFSSRSMFLGQQYQPSEALKRAFSIMAPRASGDATSLLARFGRLVLILHLYHNYTSCIASSSLDFVWLTCQHVINSLVRLCFRRLRVLDISVPVCGMDISTLPAAVFLWSIHLHHSSTVASNIVWQFPCLHADDFYTVLSAAFSEWLLSWLSFCDV